MMSFVANVGQIESELRRAMGLKKCCFEHQFYFGDLEFILKPIHTVV